VIADTNKETSKALVLSGGGITGTAWELGVLFGLEECGVDVTDVELIVGTSAGSSVGAQITSGLSLEELYNLQLKPIHETLERPVDFDGHKFRQMMAAAIMSSPDSQTARARIGEAALAAPTMSEEERLKMMASRLPVHEWNPEIKLIITAVDAETGEWVKFDRDSGVPLLLAVSASSAVPGIYPPTTINGRRYIDGGMSSGTNADVAQGYQRVLIIAAEPSMIAPAMGPTMHRISFNEEMDQLKQSGSHVKVLSPDEESLKTKGPNPLDANFRGVSAEAGRKQGQKIAAEVKAFWDP